MKALLGGIMLCAVLTSCKAALPDSLKFQQLRSTAVSQSLAGLCLFAAATVAFTSAQPWTKEADELDEIVDDLPPGELRDAYSDVAKDYRRYARKINAAGYACAALGMVLEFCAVSNVLRRAPYSAHAQILPNGGIVTLAFAL